MKYLPLRDLDAVTNALNFSTADCHVIGGCDVYTTKAAAGDKKLYKNIENSLESQYESLVRLSASLSPPYRTASEDGKESEKDGQRGKRGRSVGVPEIDLSRSSPFGKLSQLGARRTFAYLIATLNASHPDYDFSHRLRPSDFRNERDLRRIIRDVDTQMRSLRPRQHKFSHSAYLALPSAQLANSAPALNRSGTEVWSPRMWNLIEKEMDLQRCELYSYAPDDDPFEGEESSIWSMHYFFFNKEKKRVCYLHLRGLSVISHSPVYAPAYPARRSKAFARKASSVTVGDGAGKRASYWLGNSMLQDGIDTTSYDDDDDDEMIIEEPNDDEVEVPYMDLDEIRTDLVDGYYSYDTADDDDFDDAYLDEGWKPIARKVSGGLGGVRRMSEEIGDSVEI